MSFFGKIRSGLVAVEHGVEHGAVVAGKGSFVAIKFAAPIAIPILTHELLTPEIVESVFKLGIGKDTESMNPLEQMGIMLVLSAIQSTVKNPAHKAALQNQLLMVADDIYIAYGRQPAAAPTTTL